MTVPAWRRTAALAAALIAGLPATADAHDLARAARLGRALAPTFARLDVQPARGLRETFAGTATMRTVLIPILWDGVTGPDVARSTAIGSEVAAFWQRATGGHVTVESVVAAPIHIGDPPTDPRQVDDATLAAALDSAAAGGVDVGGRIPVWIVPGSPANYGLGGPSLGVVLYGRAYELPSVPAHELGHVVGLMHARSPACLDPTCDPGGPGFDEYGDMFDIMGEGADDFAAWNLIALGAVTPVDAQPTPGTYRLAPIDDAAAPPLRLRTSDGQWLVEARRDAAREALRQTPGDVLREATTVATDRVIIQRGPARLERGATGFFGPSYRYVPTRAALCDPGTTTAVLVGCLGEAQFAPGDTFTVPGAFTLAVAPSSDGAAYVTATWTDREPALLGRPRARIVHPWGARPFVDVALSARVAGAALERVDLALAGTTTGAVITGAHLGGSDPRIRTSLPLPRRGRRLVVSAVDAAGNRSAERSTRIDRRRARRMPWIIWRDQALADAEPGTTTGLKLGTTLTVQVTADPRLRGRTARLELVPGRGVGAGPIATTARLDRRGRAVLRILVARRGSFRIVASVPRAPGDVPPPARVASRMIRVT